MRRTFWLAAGFGLGLYAGERMRRTVVALMPDTLGERMRTSVADAVEVGRVEMRLRERRMREVLAAPDRSSRPHARTPNRGSRAKGAR